MPQVGQRRKNPFTGKEQVFNSNHRWENADKRAHGKTGVTSQSGVERQDFNAEGHSPEEIREALLDQAQNYGDYYLDKYAHLDIGSEYQYRPNLGPATSLEDILSKDINGVSKILHEDVEILNQMIEIALEDNPTEENRQEMRDLYDQMRNSTSKVNSISYFAKHPEDEDLRNALRDLAEDLYDETNAVRLSEEELADKRAETANYNSRLINANNAMKTCFKNEDEVIGYYKNIYGRDTHFYVDAATNYLSSISDSEFDEVLRDMDEKNSFYLNPYERAVKALSTSQGLYLSSVFPEKHLAPKLEQYGVDNVFVSNFQNGREFGNVYTVMEPDNFPMSFCVYEHRNSDSIIINGKRGWDGEELPYAADNKHAFFAEFSPQDADQAADTLAMYLKDAQNGELHSVNYMVENAQRRDWNAILSKNLPGFQDFLEQHNPMEALRIADNSDERVLDDLDFDVDY